MTKYMPLNTAIATFGLSKSTIYRAAKSGDLDICKVGRSSLVSTESLEEFFAKAPRLYPLVGVLERSRAAGPNRRGG